MRLQLDTNNTANSAEAAGQNTGPSGPGKAAGSEAASAGAVTGTGGSNAGGSDQVAVSRATEAWSASFTDRAARIGQLAATVQSGTYRIPSVALAQSIVASATA